MSDTLYLVVPCFNEEEVLPETSQRLKENLTSLIKCGLAGEKSKILFVDDGSTDETWKIIQNNHFSDPIFSGVKLSCNKGHQNALLAGLMTAMPLADVTISLDADLQDDIDCLNEFMFKYYDGCDIVYGVRSDRTTDNFFKRWSAQCFYKIMKKFCNNIVYNHADYRLMSKRALEGLESFREVNLFLRGMIPLIGYKTGTVEYSRGKRIAGKTKYPLKKMMIFAWNGISSFSIRPIRYITLLGFIISSINFFMLTGNIIIRNTLFICMNSLWLLGGFQLMAIGLIGEYIGKIYTEVKDRPKYIVDSILDTEFKNNDVSK